MNNDEEHMQVCQDSPEYDEAAAIRANAISTASRRIYHNSNIRFLLYLYEHESSLLTSFLKDKLTQTNSEKQQKKEIEAFLEQNIDPPIIFSNLTAPVIIKWVRTIKNKKNENLGYSASNIHRSAVFNLFRKYHQTMSEQLRSELCQHYRGLKRLIAEQTSLGMHNIKVGKDHLKFDFFRFICFEMFHMPREFVFARFFLTICWNLMCRSANAFSICLNHMEWSEDALCIFFAHQKNDQTGERPRDPRHVYCNPLMPEICPILALGMYWMCFPIGQSLKLFPGSNQYERFRKCLDLFFQKENVVLELQRRGMKA